LLVCWWSNSLTKSEVGEEKSLFWTTWQVNNYDLLLDLPILFLNQLRSLFPRCYHPRAISSCKTTDSLLSISTSSILVSFLGNKNVLVDDWFRICIYTYSFAMHLLL
jgi:hypothetical protein